jgi:hypothetical protein
LTESIASDPAPNAGTEIVVVFGRSEIVELPPLELPPPELELEPPFSTTVTAPPFVGGKGSILNCGFDPPLPT